MKVVKVSALWCSSCLVMNKVWKKVQDIYHFSVLEVDYDFDEEAVKKYNVGDILPVFIFFEGDKELFRTVGEISQEEMIKLIEENGGKL